MNDAMMRVLIAPDKFKGSLTGAEVAAAVARGIHSRRPDVDLDLLPVADGGDGTLDAALAAGFSLVEVTVSGPTGTPVRTGYALRGDVAVVEMADACGLSRLPGELLAPLAATSRGLGEVMAAALDAGCRTLVVGVGGSASTDGGSGMVTALGARLLDVDAEPVPNGGQGLAALHRIDMSGLHPALAAADVILACDVDNPLTGPQGAASVFGPQKGATVEQVSQLDASLSRWADLVALDTGVDHRDAPGAGAAGGVGFAAIALLGARLRPGIELILELVGFDERVAGVDLVVTGEGSLDAQSLHGKAPIGVARAARAAGASVVAVCGRRVLGDEEMRNAGIQDAYALLDLEPDAALCMREAAPLLERLGAVVADGLSARTLP